MIHANVFSTAGKEAQWSWRLSQRRNQTGKLRRGKKRGDQREHAVLRESERASMTLDRMQEKYSPMPRQAARQCDQDFQTLIFSSNRLISIGLNG